jgi:hypothetical protein
LKDWNMTTLAEALAAERDNRRREAEDASTGREVGRALLQALAQRLNADPLPAWSFTCTGDEILITHTTNGPRKQVGSWTVGEKLRLVLAGEMTEWVTAESCARVIDEAVLITARLIVDADAEDVEAPQRAGQAAISSVSSGEVIKLPRFV